MNATMPPILQVKNLSVQFDDQEAIEDLSFEVETGKTLGIIGPNGAGKTVLFRALLGLVKYEGQIKWAKDVKIGYVPQKLYVERELPLTVDEFLSFKLKNKNRESVFEALKSVDRRWSDEHHLQNHLLPKRLGQLSGGEFQKVIVAWAVLDKPNVLLLDEPAAGVDIGGEESIYSLIHKLQKEMELTILLISHDLHIVSYYTDAVLCLNKTIICHGIPEEALTKESLSQLYGKDTSVYLHTHKEF